MSPKEAAQQNFEHFLADRREALLSMDRSKIEAYAHKYGAQQMLWMAQHNEALFWASVHMARTGAKDLPIEARMESKRWLTERGLRSMDEGELSEGRAP